MFADAPDVSPYLRHLFIEHGLIGWIVNRTDITWAPTHDRPPGEPFHAEIMVAFPQSYLTFVPDS